MQATRRISAVMSGIVVRGEELEDSVMGEAS